MSRASVPSARTWFTTITRPTGRLLTTIGVLIVFVLGISLGNVYSEFEFWFYAPAIAAILGWFIVMMRIYRNAKNGS